MDPCFLAGSAGPYISYTLIHTNVVILYIQYVGTIHQGLIQQVSR